MHFENFWNLTFVKKRERERELTRWRNNIRRLDNAGKSLLAGVQVYIFKSVLLKKMKPNDVHIYIFIYLFIEQKRCPFLSFVLIN